MAYDPYASVASILAQFDIRLTAAEAGTRPILGNLSLSTAIISGTVTNGTINGTTTGSDLTLSPAVTGLTLNSGERTYSFDGSATAGAPINIVETLANAVGSPKSNAIGVVGAAAPTLGTLNLSGPLTNGTSTTGAIVGATSGSTITSNVTGLTVNSGARTYSFNGTAAAGTTANGLVETLAGAIGSPKSSAVTVVAASATARTGTSPTLYSVMGTGIRQATTAPSVPAGFPFQCSQKTLYAPDYQTTGHRLFFPTFYNLAAGQNPHEIATTSPITLRKIGVRINSGSWVDINPELFPIIVDPAATSSGVLIPALAALTIPANARVDIRVSMEATPGMTVPGLTRSATDMSVGSASNLDAACTDGRTLNNTNTVFTSFVAMIGKGGDGRPAILAFGDSIMAGANQRSYSATYNARGEFGFTALGLDSSARSKRLGYLIVAVEGQTPSTWAAGTVIAKKLALVSALRGANANGEAPWDELHNQLGTGDNTSDLATRLNNLRGCFAQFRAASGSPAAGQPGAMRAVQYEMIAYPTSTNGYNDLAGQSAVSAAATYPTGNRWSTNAACGGPDGLGDPAATLRADGTIQSSIAPWRRGSFDTGNNRDKVMVLPFLDSGSNPAKLAADYPASGPLILTADPGLGAYLAVRHTGGVMYAMATGPAVPSGGNFSVPIQPESAVAITVANNLSVNRTMQGGGLHPGGQGHAIYAEAIEDWKVAQGYV